MIDRLIKNELLELLTYFPALGIIGSRQVGKTTLVKQMAGLMNKETIYLDLENPDDLSKLTEPTLFLRMHTDQCVILDEIQRIPGLFPILRSLIDENRTPARFILTGSASPDLIRDSSESLAGRIAYKELTPLNITEVTENTATILHWFRGGYPLSLLAPSDKLAKRWLDNYIQTYIERDLPLLGLKVSPTALRNLWTMLAHIHGNILNMSLLSKSLEISSPTLKRYLHFLSEAFLLRILEPYYYNIKKRLVKSPKVFLRDTGILHAILGIPSPGQLGGNPVVGNSWEGYVIEQIFVHCQNELGLYYYRTHQGAECDLILTKANRPVAAIEIKYTSSPNVTRGLRIAIEDLKTHKNFIVCPVDNDYPIAKNITVCNVLSFIKNHLPAI